ncbi:hypothetical protein PGT21_050035 [Puccinia graminis f. sp. tritici]|uniref:Reverse transcriptase domain-containing protein n=1 Tax=Puccinia graminis f. sp. tritici TaxID=56615 RepID=A0A5B0QLA9_PUCGR|nr:hypothetical protein PGT21_050035 [Puccinia graminis f. sp. tritici]KAA1113724.1 hypothetical protein PGTUg99_050244 [Puccinia graminis f. sp. tritici]
MIGTTIVTPDCLSRNQHPSNPNLSQSPAPSVDSLDVLCQDIEASENVSSFDSNSLSIFQLNCHVSKSVTLSVLNSSFSFDFLLLQEPWINPIDFCPPQHQAWRAFAAYEHSPTRWNERHKAVIYAKRSIPSEAIRLLEGGSQNVVGVEVTQSGKVFSLLNIYNPPSSFSSLDELNNWLTLFYSRQRSLIISMDANLHHRHWNPPGVRKTEPEARTLLSSLSSFGFRVASPKHIPTFYSKKGKGSTIDLVWANYLGSKLIKFISVSDKNFGSDHQALLIQLSIGRPAPTYHWRYPSWSKLDSTKLNKASAKLSRLTFDSPTDPNVQAEQLTSFLQRTQQDLGQRVRSNQAKVKPWWCRQTLDPVLKTRNRARRWMHLAKSPEAIECYRQWNSYFLSLVASLKQRSWRRLLEDPAEGDLYRVLRFSSKSAGGEVLPLKDPEGSVVHDKHKQAELLFKGTSITNAPIDLSDIPPNQSIRFVSYPPVTNEEVRSALRRISPKKAPGVDGLANELLKSFSEPLSAHLSLLYNNILKSSTFPVSWKVAVTVIIRKHGKPDYTSPTAYRPIALLSTMSKLFELLLARRLTAWAEDSGVLAEGHFGGRKGSGTEDALFALEHWVKAKWKEGKVVAGLFLDVKSAYPSVHPARLIQYLFELKCPTYLVLIIEDFLRDRSTTIRLDDFVSEALPITIGLPQGSPLSVILYILYNNSLLNQFFSTSLDSVSIGYVDDVVHLVADRSAETAKKRLTEEGCRSLKWGASHGAIFDQAKAQFLWLTKRKMPDGDFLFGDQRLKPATEVKWLGVWLDSKLLFNRNFRVLEEKAHKTINQLKIFGSSRWGAKEADRVKLIRSVLFPRILYGAALWATKPNKGKVAALAAKINRLAGIFTLGVFKATSSSFIQNRSAAPDFLDEVIRTSFSFFFRKLVTIKPNSVIRSFILRSRSDSMAPFADSARNGLATEQLHQAMGMKPEKIHLFFDFGGAAARVLETLHLGMSKEEALISVKSIVSFYDADPRAVVIFSDGSFHPEKGGAGAAVCPTRNVFSSLSLGGNPLVSNHESEAAGVLAATFYSYPCGQSRCSQKAP